MIVKLTENYELIIIPENPVETLALRAWNENENKILLIQAYEKTKEGGEEMIKQARSSNDRRSHKL